MWVAIYQPRNINSKNRITNHNLQKHMRMKKTSSFRPTDKQTISISNILEYKNKGAWWGHFVHLRLLETGIRCVRTSLKPSLIDGGWVLPRFKDIQISSKLIGQWVEKTKRDANVEYGINWARDHEDIRMVGGWVRLCCIACLSCGEQHRKGRKKWWTVDWSSGWVTLV